MRLYVNGVLKDNTVRARYPFGARDTSSNFNIGRDPIQTTKVFDGKIDDVRIYNYPLTSPQIKEIYNGGAVKFGE